ncbi:hypothetical protein APA_1435 [Pseudanabaena sp. lw0831]|uniref:isocitrate/isopropylmalate family dehydrogenase n=1 Tax=Pseudanabaena sp. lw0831 TaxID=1357935 RepID=UPI001A2E89B4|nr:isocitrate/isopropylmalate family dehydrogenase [Pseudanabaena sp. lw0831]GBO53528.1 hypothetical protein APA_1435 [Pseudanabaena sp. lw0831]
MRLGEPEAAILVQKAVEAVIAEGKYVNYDLATADSSSVGTQKMAEAIATKATP